MEKKTVEILMATRNGEAFLQEQVDSILAQTDDGWHLTVSDDGSTDRTGELLDEYVHRFPKQITRIHSGRHFGNARDHFFYLIRACKAEWMMLCDQDDTWVPEKIVKFRKAAEEAGAQYGGKKPILIFCDQTPTDAALHPIAESLMDYQKQRRYVFDFRGILMQNVVTGGAMALNRVLAELSLECNDFSRVIMHDWWMAAVAARFGKIIYLDETLGTYRQHEENTVGAKAVGSTAYIQDRMSKISAVKETIRKKKEQAKVFQDTYSERLTEADLLFLQGFGKNRSGLGFYWKYRKLIHGAERKAGLALLG